MTSTRIGQEPSPKRLAQRQSLSGSALNHSSPNRQPKLRISTMARISFGSMRGCPLQLKDKRDHAPRPDGVLRIPWITGSDQCLLAENPHQRAAEHYPNTHDNLPRSVCHERGPGG